MGDVSAIFLRGGEANQVVSAELIEGIAEAHLLDWKAKWQPALVELLKEMHKQGIPATQWPQSWHWDWSKKAAEIPGMLAFRGFAVTCAGDTQGLMRADLEASGRATVHFDKPLVYVDYLETAPWNWSELGRTPRYRGVGSALLTAAITLSVDEDFGGSVALHSLPQSEEFYRRAGMINLGQDPAVQNLTYFEMPANAAQAFLK